MSADLLRRAAKTLREHAEPATRNMGTSAWKIGAGNGYPQRVTNDRAILIAECFESGDSPAFAPYVALMHPPVALALAECMDQAAWMGEHDADLLLRVAMPEIVAVARAILREGATDAS